MIKKKKGMKEVLTCHLEQNIEFFGKFLHFSKAQFTARYHGDNATHPVEFQVMQKIITALYLWPSFY